MARFRLRSWQEQTLYDCRDYEVEAGTVEEAAELLGELQFEAQEISGPVDLPPNVRCIDGTGRERFDDLLDVLDARRVRASAFWPSPASPSSHARLYEPAQGPSYEQVHRACRNRVSPCGKRQGRDSTRHSCRDWPWNFHHHHRQTSFPTDTS